MARRPNHRRGPSGADLRPLIAAFGRLDRRAQLLVLAVLAVVGAVAAVIYVRGHRDGPPGTGTGPVSDARTPDGQGPTAPGAVGAGDHLLLGNPSGATPTRPTGTTTCSASRSSRWRTTTRTGRRTGSVGG
jgi:hypothetical protein